MARKLIAVMRRALIGPVLHRISTFNNHELSSLLVLTSSDPVTQEMLRSDKVDKDVKGQVNPAMTIDVSPEVEALKEKIAVLSERIEVLERLARIRVSP